MKEIKEIFRFALCAQPVPKALSVISFISAGLEILCAACAEGTFCDFREFLCDNKNKKNKNDYISREHTFFSGSSLLKGGVLGAG